MCPETSVTIYQTTPRNIPEELKPWLMVVGCCNGPMYSLQTIGGGNTQQSGEMVTKCLPSLCASSVVSEALEVRNGRLSAEARFELSYSYLKYTDGHTATISL